MSTKCDENAAFCDSSALVTKFRKLYFAEVQDFQWNNWHWQMRNKLKNHEQIERIFKLSVDEKEALIKHDGVLPIGVTPYYASLFDRENPEDPLRRTHFPVTGEYLLSPGESNDPLGEDGHSVVPGLVHRYPDRVLFLVTSACATYCRYCTRSRMVGGGGGEYSPSKSGWDKAFAYLEQHSEIRDVLLSGGDPLLLLDENLDYLLGRLRAIKHIEFLRIGTKIPVVMPMRVTHELTNILKKHHSLFMSLHFTHPLELTEEVKESCGRLADAGIPLGSQTVLLKGINDRPEIIKELMQKLLTFRVKPYYIYQCDPIKGSSHFRTSVDTGVDIIRQLRGFTSGYAVPTFVIDAPGGGGKIPVAPDYVEGRKADNLLLRNYENKIYSYLDPI